MTVKELLITVYREVGVLESLERQRAMLFEDNTGLKAIRYDSDKVSGGRQTDLSMVIEQIEQKQAKIEELISRQKERVTNHRITAYIALEGVEDSRWKSAMQEHYLYGVPWSKVADNMDYDKDWVRKRAYATIKELDQTHPVSPTPKVVK